MKKTLVLLPFALFALVACANNSGKKNSEKTSEPASQPAQTSESSTPAGSSEEVSEAQSQQGGAYTYTVTGLPDWIQNDGCVIFAWVWSPSDQGSWQSLAYGQNADASFDVEAELTGFLLARCKEGTETPDWHETGDVAGRVYNKTADITCEAGTYSYACGEWSSYTYNPQ